MKLDAQKNRSLTKQYPFVSAILLTKMEPVGTGIGADVDDLVINVEKADGDLMYRQANNTGLGDSSFTFSTRKNRKDQVMRQGEYLFAISTTGEIINRVDWPKNDEEARGRDEVYGSSVLWGTKLGENHYTNCICNVTEYLVWVTVKAWHKDTKNDDGPESRFGELCDRSVMMTIYTEPEIGFSRLREHSCPQENLYLNSNVVMKAMVNNNRDLIAICGRLDELCRLFQDEVYFNGMKKVFDKGEYRGASGQFGSVKVLCAEMCGYDRVMLEDSVSWISLQLRPEATMMYVLGMGGTLPQLRNLIKSVAKSWNEKPEQRKMFRPDKEVSVM